jgi:hypothetical protein
MMDPTQAAAAMEQTLASQLIIVPFLYYPAFFGLTGVMQGLTFEEVIERAQETFVPLMKRNLLFWIPVQFIQFSVLPVDLQIPFLSVCGLAWTFILSVAAGSAKKFHREEEGKEVPIEVQMAEQQRQSVMVAMLAEHQSDERGHERDEAAASPKTPAMASYSEA